MPVEIPLTRGFVALVDEADAPYIQQFSWRVTSSEQGRTYAVRGKRKVNGVWLPPALMHREIAQPGAGLVVDHWDENGLNNQRSNLRVITTNQNTARSPKCSSMHGYRGIMKSHGRFYGRVTLNGVPHLTASCPTAAAAAALRSDLLVRLHGQLAILNVADGDSEEQQAINRPALSPLAGVEINRWKERDPIQLDRDEIVRLANASPRITYAEIARRMGVDKSLLCSRMASLIADGSVAGRYQTRSASKRAQQQDAAA